MSCYTMIYIDFRGFIHELLGAARQMLRENLLMNDRLGAATILAISWPSLRDDPTQGKAEWSFLKNTRIQWPVKGEAWLVDRLGDEIAMQRQFIQARSQPPSINIKSVNRYFQRV